MENQHLAARLCHSFKHQWNINVFSEVMCRLRAAIRNRHGSRIRIQNRAFCYAMRVCLSNLRSAKRYVCAASALPLVKAGADSLGSWLLRGACPNLSDHQTLRVCGQIVRCSLKHRCRESSPDASNRENINKRKLRLFAPQ